MTVGRDGGFLSGAGRGGLGLLEFGDDAACFAILMPSFRHGSGGAAGRAPREGRRWCRGVCPSPPPPSRVAAAGAAGASRAQRGPGPGKPVALWGARRGEPPGAAGSRRPSCWPPRGAGGRRPGAGTGTGTPLGQAGASRDPEGARGGAEGAGARPGPGPRRGRSPGDLGAAAALLPAGGACCHPRLLSTAAIRAASAVPEEAAASGTLATAWEGSRAAWSSTRGPGASKPPGQRLSCWPQVWQTRRLRFSLSFLSL